MLQVDKDLREMLIQPNAPAPQRIGIRVWPKAIPQFNLGHLDVVQVCLHCLFLRVPLGRMFPLAQNRLNDM